MPINIGHNLESTYEYSRLNAEKENLSVNSPTDNIFMDFYDTPKEYSTDVFEKTTFSEDNEQITDNNTIKENPDKEKDITSSPEENNDKDSSVLKNPTNSSTVNNSSSTGEFESARSALKSTEKM